MLNLFISISEKIGLINSFSSLKRMPTLRKNNKIKSIHSSLAIEENSLSLSQVKGVFDGDKVIFVVPLENRVLILTKKLFAWLVKKRN